MIYAPPAKKHVPWRWRPLEAPVRRIDDLKIKIFADGANFDGMIEMYRNPLIKGFTTNPTLMKAAGVTDYAGFARKVLSAIPDRPVSFEVFADEPEEMEAQALEIASWGRNVNVKIPVTNTRGRFLGPLIGTLSAAGVVVNVTAVFTLDQVRAIADALHPATGAIVSVFAGRIADSGIDPVPLMTEAAGLLRARPKADLLWASPRELLNIFQANDCGCGIITVTNDVLKKLALVGKDQDEYSLETVKMFHNDASKAGYTIAVERATP
jgi:transaldolase